MDAGLGATSLVLELFGIAIKGYTLFKCAARADIEVKTFVLRLKFEQARLSRWAEVVGLCPTSDSPTFARYIKRHESLVVDALKHISTVLSALNNLTTIHDGPSEKSGSSSGADNSRTTDISGPLEHPSTVQVLYEELTEESRHIVAPDSLKHPRGLNHLFRLAEDVFVVTKYPKRLVWAIKDQKHFRSGLKELKNLTDQLHETVSDEMMDRVLRSSHETWLAVLQLSRSVDDMKALLAAQLEISQANRPHTNLVDKLGALGVRLDITIERVTSFAILMSTQGSRESMFLNEDDISSLQNLVDADDGCRTLATFKNNPVWIEWRDYKEVPVPGDTGIEARPDDQSVRNVERLTWLLSQPNQPDEFHLPICLGYIKDSDRRRFGVVLHSLSGQPQSLLSLFDMIDVGIENKVAIARQIADSLLYLHAVNWLHKGLRSAGIMFVGSGSALMEDPGRLLMSGIGFSRPSDNSFTSTGPPPDSKWSLYCHPGYLDSGRKNGYRKSYDIYSLGIILIEIAHWKPIDRILQSIRTGRDSALGEERQDTRARILDNDSVLKQVRVNMGPAYFEATRACIEGLTAFGLGSDVDEANPYVAAVLQRSFIETVVDPLKNVRI
ncbi:hypothetical protein KCU67_g1760, partial [Aureobasidium melanogenum]